jgi:GMP reductase
MDTIGTYEVYKVLSANNIVTAMHKFYSADDYEQMKPDLNPLYYTVSTGIKDHDFERLQRIMSVVPDTKFICIDVANGYMEALVEFCAKVRDAFPSKILIAGNVVSREMTEELIIRGKVDIVKVGIGSGSACTTRMKTGVGMPQLSAIMECADAAHGVGGYIIGDGGITCPGDMAKAFAGGADFVMCGGVFSGHHENPGEVIEDGGRVYKIFYGMSSGKAMMKHYGKKDSYRSSEGRVVKVEYRGDLQNTVEDFLGGVRSMCTYVNAKKIKHVPKCVTFVRVNNQLNRMFESNTIQ